jgi:uncharacterized protein YciI
MVRQDPLNHRERDQVVAPSLMWLDDSFAVICRGGKVMKAVVIGEASGQTIDAIMAVYPRHKAVVDAFIERGDVIGIGPFTDLGNMAIFRSREAAEAFVKEDPFILEGMVRSYVIRDWDDDLLV